MGWFKKVEENALDVYNPNPDLNNPYSMMLEEEGKFVEIKLDNEKKEEKDGGSDDSESVSK